MLNLQGVIDYIFEFMGDWGQRGKPLQKHFRLKVQEIQQPSKPSMQNQIASPQVAKMESFHTWISMVS